MSPSAGEDVLALARECVEDLDGAIGRLSFAHTAGHGP